MNKIFLNYFFENYEERVKDNIFCKWEIVNGEQPIEKVTEDILNIIDKII